MTSDKEYNHILRLAFPERYREYGRRFRLKTGKQYDGDRHRKTRKDNHFASLMHDQIRRLAFPEIIRMSRMRYEQKHPEKFRDKCHRRREIVRSGRNCSDKIKELLQHESCHWCSVKMTQFPRIIKDVKIPGTSITIDHVVPLSRGGMHVPENLVASCHTCNTSKNDRLIA